MSNVGYQILARIKEANPIYGPGNAPMCEQCIEKLKQDIDRRIADEAEKICWRQIIIDGKNVCARIIALLEERKSYAKQA